VVDGSGLENRRTRKGTGGSNPSLSAIVFVFSKLYAGDTFTDSELNRRWHRCPTRNPKEINLTKRVQTRA
jgi:hypothetical protein